MSKLFMQALCTCLIVCSSTLVANNDGERVGVSTRTAEKSEAQPEKRDLPQQQQEEPVTNAQEIVVAAEASEAAENDGQNASKRDLAPRKTYTTTHNGAFHYMMFKSFFGDTVELEDGSVWGVRSFDWSKTNSWYSNDPIIILPNSSFSYEYKLLNTATGGSIEVELNQGPYYTSYYRHWVVAVDTFWDEVYLEDGSKWKVSIFDSSKMEDWDIGDTVIIGVNDDWMMSSKPNILINVNMDHYVRANCL